MARLVLVLAVLVVAAAGAVGCERAEQQQGGEMTSDTMHMMMGDSAMMSDTGHMMAGDTAKRM